MVHFAWFWCFFFFAKFGLFLAGGGGFVRCSRFWCVRALFLAVIGSFGYFLARFGVCFGAFLAGILYVLVVLGARWQVLADFSALWRAPLANFLWGFVGFGGFERVLGEGWWV